MMDTAQVLATLQQDYGPLPAALVQQLGEALTPGHYPRGQVLLRPGQTPRHAWFLGQGMARGYVLDSGKGEEVTLWFWLQGEAVVALDSFCRQVPATFYLELLEESLLYRLSFQDVEALASRFPAFRRLERSLVEKALLRIARHLLDRSRLPVRERYEKLLLHMPQLFQRVPVKHVASYLGMYPDTLSRLRAER